MEKIKTGLIGYGFSGATFHAPFLKALDEFDLIKVLSSNQEKVQNDLGNITVAEKMDDIINDPEIELVVITTPNTLHYEMAKQSLIAKKHVIIEKPMVVDPEEAKELIQLAKQNNVMLSVYQNRRWDNDFLTIKHLISEGSLGEITTYEAHFDRFRPNVRNRWREQAGKGSGMLYDLGSHLIDQALHLFGTPQFVLADVFAQREQSQVDDYFHIILGYEQRRVILHSGSIVKGQGPKFAVHGSKGSFIKYGLDGQEDALKAGKIPTEKDWGKDKEEWYGALTIDENGKEVTKKIETIPGSYTSYYRQVYDHIRSGKANPVPGEDGLKTIQVIHAALQSSKEKKAVFFNNQKQ
ncbi:oxidoreductase [Heyndrickxia ginsengihumi]|uniref:Oxidoreductase n=1 Tax=Heyndrickxia ginsengihumi TaxID=363870 RepID=A0A0A6Y2Y6_9BACI|nr:oxidoreductase [Heyndrickxia ginsengihumi]KHD86642.1 oxidoreductase [Heyndrickxia ginsengihumi]MBE6185195.1 oxidoreductase [Bacillus sp. (in: firmicutes)]MCM3022685.1 oxidoreductase [Heyndrickxia ginsengihumi]NEY18977.1 oxidoreductase [Heyndrickxia ginsengihumi]